MASLGSYTRSAARATFSAYRTVPIRWRLAGGSAVLTLVILAGFAAIVGVLTDRQVTRQFDGAMKDAVTSLGVQLRPYYARGTDRLVCDRRGFDLTSFADSEDAQIRVFDLDSGAVLCTQSATADTPRQMASLQPRFTPPYKPGTYWQDGYRVVAGSVRFRPSGEGMFIYARPQSAVNHTTTRVRFFLILGVLAGTVFALLAGLATAQRAMRPIAQLSDAAREIARTRDPSRRIPHPEADDEIAELARTLEGMLGALDASRAETEAALARQREFVADASHELRTPLTSVLANLELLADELSGEQADSAKAALRSTRRMRRLVGDLLLLARADADRLERGQPHRPTDLGAVLTDAAAELGPVADEHELTIDAHEAIVPGVRDDLHRLVLNLLENALRHTPPGTHVRACTGMRDGVPRLIVEDDGPGIPPELTRRVFERFVRGGGDSGRHGGAGIRGTGLGLAIVRAVADAHGATVTLERTDEQSGTRFAIEFRSPPIPPAPAAGEDGAGVDGAGVAGRDPATQTSTTTGSTIGRRRSRS